MLQIGYFCYETQDGVVIYGSTINQFKQKLDQKRVIQIETEKDHRLIMAFSIFSQYLKTKTDGMIDLVIRHKNSTSKTNPNFFIDFESNFGYGFNGIIK